MLGEHASASAAYTLSRVLLRGEEVRLVQGSQSQKSSTWTRLHLGCARHTMRGRATLRHAQCRGAEVTGGVGVLEKVSSGTAAGRASTCRPSPVRQRPSSSLGLAAPWSSGRPLLRFRGSQTWVAPARDLGLKVRR